MRITQEFHKHGNICGWKYYLNKGQGIPMHVHKEPQYLHNIVVLKGSVSVYGKDWQKTVTDVLDFDSLQPHEICALEDDTIIINVFTNGLPENWEQMLEEGKQEVEVSPLVGPPGDK